MPANVQDSSREPATEAVILLFVVIGLITIINIAFHDQLVFAILKLSEFKLSLVALLTGNLQDIHAVRELSAINMHSELVKRLTVLQAFSVDNAASRYYAWPLVIPLVIGGLWLIRNDPRRKYRRKFTMESLLENKARTFPAVRPIVGLDLLDKKTLLVGPWRVSEDYLRFSLAHGLILREIEKDIQSGSRTYKKGKWIPAYRIVKRMMKPTLERSTHSKNYDRKYASRNKFDTQAAREVFVKQLGRPLFEGGDFNITEWQKWPKQHRALMAVFLLARYGGENSVGREAAFRMLEQFDNSYYYPDWRKTGKPKFSVDDLDMTGVDQVISHYVGIKYALAKDEKPYEFPKPSRSTINEIRREFYRHAWLNTLMIRLLLLARERGILITADFIWLRPIDRTLFYTLNNVGRNNVKNATGLAEGAGSMAHFMVEESLNKGCIVPEVDKAVMDLHKALIGEGWLDPESDAVKTRIGKRVS